MRVCNVTFSVTITVTVRRVLRCLSFPETLHAVTRFRLSIFFLIYQQAGVFVPIVQLLVSIQKAGLYQSVYKCLRFLLPETRFCDGAVGAAGEIAIVCVLDSPRPQTYQQADGKHVGVDSRAGKPQFIRQPGCFRMLGKIAVNLNPRDHCAVPLFPCAGAAIPRGCFFRHFLQARLPRVPG